MQDSLIINICEIDWYLDILHGGSHQGKLAAETIPFVWVRPEKVSYPIKSELHNIDILVWPLSFYFSFFNYFIESVIKLNRIPFSLNFLLIFIFYFRRQCHQSLGMGVVCVYFQYQVLLKRLVSCRSIFKIRKLCKIF